MRNSRLTRLLLAMGVASLLLSVSACKTLDEPPPPRAPTKTPIPDLDPRTEALCKDPGVADTYGDALIENRAFAMCERARHVDSVEAYKKAQREFGGTP